MTAVAGHERRYSSVHGLADAGVLPAAILGALVVVLIGILGHAFLTCFAIAAMLISGTLGMQWRGPVPIVAGVAVTLIHVSAALAVGVIV